MKATPPTVHARPPGFSFPVLRREIMDEFARQELPPTKLTQVAAPPGYGKTIFLTALYRHYQDGGKNVLWATLEERNTTVEAFVGLLESVFPPRGAAGEPTRVVQGNEFPLAHRIADLLDSIRALQQPTVLIVDNLSFLQDPAVGEVIQTLVDQTPRDFYLVLAGTRDLDLDLTRLEIAGLLTRVGYAQLAFKLPQIQQAFGEALSSSLGSVTMHRIIKRTEGWPAAVRLMQILLSNSDNPAATVEEFSGSDKDLAEMLNRGALAHFPAEVRNFLFEIAPLRQFSVALCRSATGNEQAGVHIDYLLENHFFILPVDRNRKWYRLHGMLRQFLLAEAEEQVTSERRREVLSAAAGWCDANDLWADAIDYALLAADRERAAAIVDRVPARFVRDAGDVKAFTHWVELLEEAQVQLSWDARYWYVWALVFCRRYDQVPRKAEPLREEVLAGRTENQLERVDRERLQRLDIIRISADIYLDRLEAAYVAGARWLQNAAHADPFDRATVACVCGIRSVCTHDFAQARKDFAIAHASIVQADSDYGSAWVGTLICTPLLAEGEFARAYDALKLCLQRTRKALGDRAGMTSTVALVAAKAAVETGRDLEAREWLELAFPMATSHGVLDTGGHGIDAALKLWGSPHATSLTLEELRAVVTGYPPRLAVMFSCWVIRRLIRLGRLEDALAEARKLGTDDGQLGAPSEEHPAVVRSLWVLTQIDLSIANGQLKRAEALIEAESARAREDGRHGHLVELLMSQMTIHVRGHDQDAATRKLAAAVRLAAKRRYLRPFLECGERVASVVNETKPKSWGFVLKEEQDFFAEICRSLPVSGNRILDRLEELEVDTSLLEQPTPRELEMLALIEAGLSNKQLADRLELSVPTVKWHLYNLYQKLGVSSRAAAAAKAKALHLLSV